jgi:gluconate 2-dehydrogenase alpha chain
MYSKASPNVNILPALRQEKRFELRTNANVLKVNLTDDKSRATGVTYVDGQGREMEQPADLVIIGAFQFHNVHLMLLSGIGKPYNPETGEGVVGRNFAYQNMTTIKAIFDKDTYTNPFIGAGGNGVGVDDFNADNFDHGAAGFVGGSPFWVNQAGTKPISGFRYRRAPRRGAASGKRRWPIPTPITCRWMPTARTSPIGRTTSILIRTTKTSSASRCCE